MKLTVAVLFAVLLPYPALADFAASKACANNLSPSASAIYSGTLKAISSGADPRTALQKEVKALVSNGTVSKENAKGVTEAAVQCMKMLKQ